jgi:hypothetical protein
VQVTVDNLNEFLGVRKYTYGRAEQKNQVGQVVGLAWTEVGGDLLTIEAALMPGKGVITRTGSLGDVMKESVEAARTVVRSRSRLLGIKDEVFEKKDEDGWRWKRAMDGMTSSDEIAKAESKDLTKLSDKYDYKYDPDIDDYPPLPKYIDEVEKVEDVPPQPELVRQDGVTSVPEPKATKSLLGSPR